MRDAQMWQSADNLPTQKSQGYIPQRKSNRYCPAMSIHVRRDENYTSHISGGCWTRLKAQLLVGNAGDTKTSKVSARLKTVQHSWISECFLNVRRPYSFISCSASFSISCLWSWSHQTISVSYLQFSSLSFFCSESVSSLQVAHLCLFLGTATRKYINQTYHSIHDIPTRRCIFKCNTILPNVTIMTDILVLLWPYNDIL